MDSKAIGAMLLEAKRINREDYVEALRKATAARKSICDILFAEGKITADEFAQALTIHLDIALLKGALDIGKDKQRPVDPTLALGDYLERISLLFKMGNLVHGERNIGSLLDLLIREAPMVMKAERATVFLADFDTRELYSHVGTGIEGTEIRIPWDSGIAGWVFTKGRYLNIPHPYKDPRFNREVDCCTGFTTRNILCVPLQVPGRRIIGVFQVINKRAGIFTTTDVDMLTILASQAARSIENVMDWDNLRHTVETLAKENVGLRKAIGLDDPLAAIMGNSSAIENVRSLVRRVAPTSTTVIIEGESGTGKELVAQALHRLSSRSERPMISLNCAAVPSELIESELFGHKKGSFTGAVSDHQGVFRAAHEGTIFLDEIEAMSPPMQVKLLRAIQLGEIKPVGEQSTHTVDVRLIAASNRNLDLLVREGQFREDLYYRLNVFPIHVPPLRERLEDIPIIVHHLLERLCAQRQRKLRGIEPQAMDLLMRNQWPGNVRELENTIERALVLSQEGEPICVEILPPGIVHRKGKDVRPQSEGQFQSLAEAVEDTERRFIKEILDKCNGNKTEAARILGLSRQGLRNKIYKYGLPQ
jgi:transcriptional regulator with GAF, ATPase, and Fis domain